MQTVYEKEGRGGWMAIGSPLMKKTGMIMLWREKLGAAVYEPP